MPLNFLKVLRVALDPRTITVRNSRKRAILGLLICLWSILGLSYLVLGDLFDWHYKPVKLQTYVFLPLVSIIAWLWLPSIRRSLSAHGYLLLSGDDGLSLFGAGSGFLKVERLPYSDIRSVTGTKSFFRDAVYIEKMDGTVIEVPVTFSDFRKLLGQARSWAPDQVPGDGVG